MSKKSSASADESQDEWVFDSLVGFLRGPVWNVPILTFIEHKSLIFEPDADENEPEYKKIHDEYKNLVDFMLGSYMEDIGITPEQFEAACGVASKKIKSQFHHALFEQVWAADDFVIFKRMMIQKNIELQLQALELLQQRYGVLPSSLRPGKDDDGKKKKSSSSSKKTTDDSEAKVMEEVANTNAAATSEICGRQQQEQQQHLGSEDEILNGVMRKSLAEHKANMAKMDKEKKELEEAVAKSNDDQRRLEAQKQNQQMLLAEHFKNKVSISDPSKVLGAPMAAPPPSSGPGDEIDPAELKRRTEFLKAQRDKLLAMKKEERERQLAEAERQQAKSRPKSARAARSAFGKGGRASGAAGIDPQTLKVRRALAEKLKQEVIGKT